MLIWLNLRHQHSHHCNWWCTQLLDVYAAFHQEITWHQHSDLSIGCQLSRGLNSSSVCLSIRPSMDEQPPTSRTWLKRRRRNLAELRTTLPATMTLLPGGRDWRSANVPSPSLHHTSGISYQYKLKLLQTLKPSNENWKRFCSRQPTYSKTHNST